MAVSLVSDEFFIRLSKLNYCVENVKRILIMTRNLELMVAVNRFISFFSAVYLKSILKLIKSRLEIWARDLTRYSRSAGDLSVNQRLIKRGRLRSL